MPLETETEPSTSQAAATAAALTLPSHDGSRELHIRNYQLTLLHRAIKENVIAYLDTGTGKTLIAVLLVKYYVDSKSNTALAKQSVLPDLSKPAQIPVKVPVPRMVICLVPTIILVAQQAAVFRRHCHQPVGEYLGSMCIDDWTSEMWLAERRKVGVFVMTPVILLNALSRGVVSMHDIQLLIFDEAHHCCKNHAYAQIMGYYKPCRKSIRPRIFGMTASPVNVKPQKNEQHAKHAMVTMIKELESNLHSRVVTLEDLAEVQRVVPVPEKQHIQFRESPDLNAGSLLLTAVQTNVHSQISLQVAVQLSKLYQKEVSLCDALSVPKPLRPTYKHFDRRGSCSSMERLGTWLGNNLNHTLFSQGPYCAALLLKAWLTKSASNNVVAGIGNLDKEYKLFEVHEPTASPNASDAEDESDGGQDGTVPAEALEHLEKVLAKTREEIAVNLQLLADNNISEDSVQDAAFLAKNSLFRAVHVIIHMLVWEPVLYEALVATGKQSLNTVSTTGDTYMAAMCEVVEGALCSVDPNLLETFLLERDGEDIPAAWQQRMTCSLFSPKVTTLFQQLWDQRAAAEEALHQVGALKVPRHMLKRRQIRGMLTTQQTQATSSSDGKYRWAALVFTQRQTCAVVLNDLVQRLPTFAGTFRADVLMGESRTLRKDKQERVLGLFRAGHLNTLFTTDVAKEGLDVQHCSQVFCYDVPERPLSLVQTVGRARSVNARVVFMMQVDLDGKEAKDNVKVMDNYMQNMRRLVLMREALQEGGQRHLEAANDTENDMLPMATLMNKTMQSAMTGNVDDMLRSIDYMQNPVPRISKFPTVLEYNIPDTDQHFNSKESMSLLHRYCTALVSWRTLVRGGWQAEAARAASASTRLAAADDVQGCKPRFSTTGGPETGYRSEVYLPRHCPLKYAKGQRARNRKVAHELASFEALKQLHTLGEVDNHLQLRVAPDQSSIVGPSAPQWVKQRLLEDRITESQWDTLQTWRRPPEMDFQQQVPLTMHFLSTVSTDRDAAATAAAAAKKFPADGSVTNEQDTTTQLDTHAQNSAEEAPAFVSTSKAVPDSTANQGCDPEEIPNHDGPRTSDTSEPAVGDRTFWLASFKTMDHGHLCAPGGTPEEIKNGKCGKTPCTHGLQSSLPLGLLTLQPLPTLPGFNIFPDDATNEAGIATCNLVEGPSVKLSQQQLAYVQTYHTALLRFQFRAVDQTGGKLVVVNLSVVNQHVKLSLTPRRAVRNMGNNALQQTVGTLIESVMPDYWNSEVLDSAKRTAGGKQASSSGCCKPVSDKEWTDSSQGTWYILIPVHHALPGTPDDPTPRSNPPVVPVDVEMDSSEPGSPKSTLPKKIDNSGKATAIVNPHLRLAWSEIDAMVNSGPRLLTEMFAELYTQLSSDDETARSLAMDQLSLNLQDRIMVTNYGTRQPYLFYGFMPDSTIMTPWPQSRHKLKSFKERVAEKRLKRLGLKSDSLPTHKPDNPGKSPPPQPKTTTGKLAAQRRAQLNRDAPPATTPSTQPHADTGPLDPPDCDTNGGGENSRKRPRVPAKALETQPANGVSQSTPSPIKVSRQRVTAPPESTAEDTKQNAQDAGSVPGNVLKVRFEEGVAKKDDEASAKASEKKPKASKAKLPQKRKRQRTTVYYSTYQDYYEKKHNISNLEPKQPLMQARGFALHTSGVNFLMPPHQGSRRREEKRVQQLAAISHALCESQKVVETEAAADGKDEPAVGGTNATAATAAARSDYEQRQKGVNTSTDESASPSVVRWGSRIKLVPQLCSVHPLKLSLWRALQCMPSLVYRLQGLLMAHELKERLRPKWLSEEEAPSAVKVLEAITHRSCADAIDFERYELLGDAFLKFAAANHVFNKTQSTEREGNMSLELHRLVSNGTLWRAAWITKWLAVDGSEMEQDENEWRLRGVVQALRLSPYRLNYWTPPGLLDVVKPTMKKILGKVVADAMEALIGVFYEAVGPHRTNCWLACLGLLPGAPTVPDPDVPQESLHNQYILSEIDNNRDASTFMMFHGAEVPDGEGNEIYVPQDAFEYAFMAPQYCLDPAVLEAHDAKAKPPTPEEAALLIIQQEKAGQEALGELKLIPQSVTVLPAPSLNMGCSKVQECMANGVGHQRISAALTRPHPQPRLPPAPCQSDNLEQKYITPYLLRQGACTVLSCCAAAKTLSNCTTTAPIAQHRIPLPAPVETNTQGLEEILGVSFKDPQLMRTACVHASWMHHGEEDYGRLEFLGDAVLGLVVTTYIFYSLGADTTKSMDPGQLSDLRSSIVKNDCLAIMAVVNGLHRFLLHSSPALFDVIQTFKRAVDEKLRLKDRNPVTKDMSTILYIITGCGMGYMGSMDAPKAMGDVLESLIGAAYLDANRDPHAVWPVVMKLLHGLRGVSPTTYPKHPILILSRLCSRAGLNVRFVVAENLDTVQECVVFRGRARIRGLWISTICYAPSRRALRTKISEEVLQRIRYNPKWLQQMQLDEDGHAIVVVNSTKWSALAAAANGEGPSILGLTPISHAPVTSGAADKPPAVDGSSTVVGGVGDSSVLDGVGANEAAGSAPMDTEATTGTEDANGDANGDSTGDAKGKKKTGEKGKKGGKKPVPSLDPPGVPTLAELQIIIDNELDDMKVNAELDRLKQMRERRAQQRRGYELPAMEQSNKRALEYRKAHPSMMEAAGTGDGTTAPPAALMFMLKTHDHFTRPQHLPETPDKVTEADDDKDDMLPGDNSSDEEDIVDAYATRLKAQMHALQLVQDAQVLAGEQQEEAEVYEVDEEQESD